jgi:hypothetical protein
MKLLPLKLSDRELTHSRLLPSWRDGFELRHYFACIHPADYELKDPGEVVFALEIYAVIQAFSIHRLGMYRAAMRALPD